MSRIIITSAPPNPNGDLHLGHLSGPFLGADVLRRYLAQTGHDVVYVGYADDYSCYVPRRGAELDLSAAQTAHLFGRRMEETLALAGMLPDYFTHPLREPVHAEIVQRFFLELWERGAFEVEELPAYWCPSCPRYLYEAEMRGKCQFCGAAADGFYCEECGRPQDTAGLVEPHCTRCGSAPETRRLRRIVFPLDRYRERLAAYYADRPMRPALRAYLDDMLSRPLPDTTVSRVADYGIGVPLPGWEGNILDTWYSGVWGYVAATAAYHRALGEPDAGPAAWRDPDTEVYEFIGFDCSFSHALLWPALFLAHGGLRLPGQVVTNEFYRLEGDKFSTSRGHAIWGGEFLRRVPADPVRFHLCLTGPERAQTNFSAADFEATVNELLAGEFQPWIDLLLRLVREDFGGVLPVAGVTEVDVVNEVAAALEPDDFSPQRAARILRAAIADAASGGPSLEAARTGDRPASAELLAANVELLARIAAVAAPLMPDAAERIHWALGIAPADPVRRVLRWPGKEPLVAAGQPITTTLPPLFRTVEL